MITVQRQVFTKKSIEGMIPIKLDVSEVEVNRINALASDEELQEAFKENIVSFSSVLAGNNSNSITDYVNAVTYTSWVLLGKSQLEAWGKVFPDRMQRLQALGKNTREMSNHASAYTRTKLVVKIMQQTLTPSYIYNASLFQKTLTNMYDIAMNEDSLDKDRIAAGAEVLKHTAIPEGFDLDKGVVTDKSASLIEKLADTVSKMADTQRTLITDGVLTPNQVANTPLYEVVEEAEVVEDGRHDTKLIGSS